MRRCLYVCLVLVSASPALACPQCGAGIREQVRAGIFDAAFRHNLLLLAAPFPILLGIAAAIHFGWPAESAADPLDDESSREEAGAT